LNTEPSLNGTPRPLFVCKCDPVPHVLEEQDWCFGCNERPVRVEPVLPVKEEDRPEMIS